MKRVLNDRLFAWKMHTSDGSKALSFGGGEMQQVGRRRDQWRLDGCERDTNPIEHLIDCFSRLLSSLPFLRRL
jgi:hypothetical protein